MTKNANKIKTKLMLLKLNSDYNINASVENLIYRENVVNGVVKNEIVLATFYIRKNEMKNSKFLGINKYYFTNINEDYQIIKTEGKLRARYNIIRKRKNFIEQKGNSDLNNKESKALNKNSRNNENVNFGELIYIKDGLNEDALSVKEDIYAKVKNSITLPMFPIVKNNTILAGHLFVNKETAQTILDYLNGKLTTPLPSHIDSKLIDRTKELLNTYYMWVDKVYSIIKNNKMLVKLKHIVNNTGYTFYEIKLDENTFKNEIKKALKNREIYITKNKSSTKIEGFNDYFPHFAQIMAKRIEAIAEPLYRKGNVSELTKKIQNNDFKVKLLDAQIETIEAALASIDHNSYVQFICEMGTGKTFMMLATNYIHAIKNGYKMKTIILCPDHITDTVWVESVRELTDNIRIHRLKSVSDLQSFDKKGYLDDDEHRVFIVNHTEIRDSLQYEPAVIFSDVKQAFICPDCGKKVTITKKIKDEFTGKYVEKEFPVEIDYFLSRRIANDKCEYCHTKFWQPYRKLSGPNAPYIYSRELKGFLPRNIKAIHKKIKSLVSELSHLSRNSKEKEKLSKLIENYRKVELTMQGKIKESKRRTSIKPPLADYIIKKMKYRFNGLIIDEYHDFQGDSKRTEAVYKLVFSVPMVIAGTGTGMNGYADSRFKTDFMLNPSLYKKAGYNFNSQDKYQVDFGVVERRYVLKENRFGELKKITKTPKKKPGISPVIFPLFMQSSSVFLSMDDLADNLPNLEYINVPVKMSPNLEKAHRQLMKEIREKTTKDDFKNTVSVSYSFLDAPQKSRELKNKQKEVVLKTPVVSAYDDWKTEAIIKGLHKEVRLGNNKVIIYTHYSGSEINEYLYEQVKNAGFKVTMLKPVDEYSVSVTGARKKIKQEDREKFLREESILGTDILITNPELIKTGYNLTDFTVIKWVQMGYIVNTNRQADRRIFRLTQTKDCRIYYYFYENTIQEDVAKLMATKMKAASAIDGAMDEMGFESLVMERTAEEELATRFYQGIKDYVTV